MEIDEHESISLLGKRKRKRKREDDQIDPRKKQKMTVYSKEEFLKLNIGDYPEEKDNSNDVGFNEIINEDKRG